MATISFESYQHPTPQICLYQRAPGNRAIAPGRHGEPGIRPHVLQQGLLALAGTQGQYPIVELCQCKPSSVYTHRKLEMLHKTLWIATNRIGRAS